MSTSFRTAEQDSPVVGDGARGQRLAPPTATGIRASFDERPPLTSDFLERRALMADRPHRDHGLGLMPIPVDRRRAILEHGAPPRLPIDPTEGSVGGLTPAPTLIIFVGRAAAAVSNVEPRGPGASVFVAQRASSRPGVLAARRRADATHSRARCTRSPSRISSPPGLHHGARQARVVLDPAVKRTRLDQQQLAAGSTFTNGCTNRSKCAMLMPSDAAASARVRSRRGTVSIGRSRERLGIQETSRTARYPGTSTLRRRRMADDPPNRRCDRGERTLRDRPAGAAPALRRPYGSSIWVFTTLRSVRRLPLPLTSIDTGRLAQNPALPMRISDACRRDRYRRPGGASHPWECRDRRFQRQHRDHDPRPPSAPPPTPETPVTTLAEGQSPAEIRSSAAPPRRCACVRDQSYDDGSRPYRTAQSRIASSTRSRVHRRSIAPAMAHLAIRVGIALAVARLGVSAAAAAHAEVPGLDRPGLLPGRVVEVRLDRRRRATETVGDLPDREALDLAVVPRQGDRPATLETRRFRRLTRCPSHRVTLRRSIGVSVEVGTYRADAPTGTSGAKKAFKTTLSKTRR